MSSNSSAALPWALPTPHSPESSIWSPFSDDVVPEPHPERTRDNTRSGSSNSDGRASSFSCSSRTSNAAQVRDPRIYTTPLLTLTLTIHASSSLPYITRKTSDTRSDGAVVQGTYHPATHALQAVRITPRFRARQLTCSVRSSFYCPEFSKFLRQLDSP